MNELQIQWGVNGPLKCTHAHLLYLFVCVRLRCRHSTRQTPNAILNTLFLRGTGTKPESEQENLIAWGGGRVVSHRQWHHHFFYL